MTRSEKYETYLHSLGMLNEEKLNAMKEALIITDEIYGEDKYIKSLYGNVKTILDETLNRMTNYIQNSVYFRQVLSCLTLKCRKYKLDNFTDIIVDIHNNINTYVR